MMNEVRILREKMVTVGDTRTINTNKKWLENLDHFVKHINCICDIPDKNSKEYNWIRNQYAHGLSEDRQEVLDITIPDWRDIINNKDKFRKRLLLNSDWKSRLYRYEYPIDILYKDEDDLYTLLRNEIYDIHTLISCGHNIEHHLSDYNLQDCYEIILPEMDKEYLFILSAMMQVNFKRPYEFVDAFNELCILNKAHMRFVINSSIKTLTEREQIVLSHMYGLFGQKKKSLEHTSVVVDLTSVRVRQIRDKALRKLRHVSRIGRLYTTNTLLDDLKITRTTKAFLFKLGVFSSEQIEQFLDNCIDDKFKYDIYAGLNLDTIYNDLYNAYSEYTKDIDETIERIRYAKDLEKRRKLVLASIENMSLDDLQAEYKMSVRSYNCLNRAGINTVSKLVKMVMDPEECELFKIRNLGRKSYEEIRSIVMEFLSKKSAEIEEEF